MTALPQRDQSSGIVVRLPVHMKLVLRNWVVDARLAVPHRIDGWLIELDEHAMPRVRFYPLEPESYL
jgi:hypothetical protein